MLSLLRALESEEGFQRALAALKEGRGPSLVTGLGALPRAHFTAALAVLSGRRLLVICPDEQEARRMAADVEALTGGETVTLFGRDLFFHNAEGLSRDDERARIAALWRIARGEARVTVATPDALMLRTIPPEVLRSLAVELKLGASRELEDIVRSLTLAGYERTQQVEGAGQFSVRGGILDVFSPALENPVRCEFFGDEIDSMGVFDVRSQRRIENIESALILPARETPVTAASGGTEGLLARLDAYGKGLLKRRSVKKEFLENLRDDISRVRDGRSLPAADRYLDLFWDKATALDYFPEGTAAVLAEPARIKERAGDRMKLLGEDIAVLIESGAFEGGPGKLTESFEELSERLSDFAPIMLASFATGDMPLRPKELMSVTVKQLPSYGGSLETAKSDVEHYMKTGYSVVVLTRDRRRAGILREYLENEGVAAGLDLALTEIPKKKTCVVAEGAVSAGLEYPGIKLAVVTEGQLAPSFRRRRPGAGRAKQRQKLDSFTDLSPGDLVVHENYGIGRYVGMVRRVVDNTERDFVKIAYAGNDALYVPATQLDAVSKYIGQAEDSDVKLNRLGGADWTRAKTRAKAAVKDLAEGLLKLQAERRKATGFAFSPDSPWQSEFEDAFEYQETEDQLRAVREIKRDMESPVPMDRLLCGDVGYGKTEVALRAVMKCVLDGKQAAILVPTTVLAQQHYQTVTRRFSGQPVEVEVLSRFRTPAQIKKALRGIETGTTDIVIGTHKLLQKDVRFKSLGLLVVDEEQRFGVQHKERLKEISRQVDVLTLSATPIPRTLNMALSGVRDMSTIEEPPSDRQPVQTYVLEHDWGVLAEAIRREVSRGGQVYYLHNRIETIEKTARTIMDLCEGVTVAVAHGRMDEEQLGSVMEAVQAGDVQVLVCTTIIETGIDIPNVNTLIIEDADRMGLAQLHQIRGRVGRSNRRAFAYFTFRRNKVLSEVAEKRLSAIREFTEFNSGFKIAMRDLEIRGAGNILGAEQSGHLMSVGYDMYLKLLDEAVKEEKGERVPVKPECSADLAVSACIPEKYVASAEQRMDLYRRIAHIRTGEDAADMTDELIDRFGDPPPQVNSLIQIALLRGEAADTGISEISQKNGRLVFTLGEFEMERVSAVYAMEKYKKRVKVEAGSVPAVSLKLLPGERAADTALEFVKDYKSIPTGAAGKEA